MAAADLLERHECSLKRVRGRGDAVPQRMAAEIYLRALDEELECIRRLIYEVWAQIDRTRDYRKCAHHLDRAQQRMHRMLKRLARAERP